MGLGGNEHETTPLTSQIYDTAASLQQKIEN